MILLFFGVGVLELNKLAVFEENDVERACFYHLVPSGRGEGIFDEDLTHVQSREAIETIMARTKAFKEQGRETDILTVDNHVDGIYLYLKLLDY